MKRSCFGQSAARLSLCAALAMSGPVARVALAEDSAPPAKSSATEGTELFDKEIHQHVDLRLLGVAWRTLDAKLLTDVALQLREAETVLGREHAAIKSSALLEFAGKMASEGKDRETLERLARVAKAAGDNERVEQLNQMASLLADSRDLRNSDMFSAQDVQRGAVAAFGNLVLQIRAAELSGDRETLENLRKAAKGLDSLAETHRDRLYGLIDDAEQLTGDGDKDKTSDLLRALTGPSRDYDYVTGPQGQPFNSGGQQIYANGQGAQGSRVGVVVNSGDYAGVIVNDGQQTPPNGLGISSATGGMRYLITPSGAVVQSHGRLGSIIFEPGDVIINIGGVAVHGGTSVDAAINVGYIRGNRSVFVRDRNSGNVLNLFF